MMTLLPFGQLKSQEALAAIDPDDGRRVFLDFQLAFDPAVGIDSLADGAPGSDASWRDADDANRFSALVVELHLKPHLPGVVHVVLGFVQVKAVLPLLGNGR